MSEPPDETRERRLELLYELGCSFAGRIELDELIPLVVEQCRDALAAEGASVLLHDERTNELYFPYVASHDQAVAEALARVRFPADRGIAGIVLESGRSQRIDDAERDPRVYREADRVTGTITRTLLAVPLQARDRAIGVLQVTNRRGDATFSDDDLAFLESLGGSVAVAIENARLYAAVKESEGRWQTEVGTLRRDLARHEAFDQIVGTGSAMSEVFRLMESAAAAPVSVLVQGETGTGKELVARALHRASPRARGPFIAVNCAAIPESLLESELFGHRRGSFTGALADRVGLFEAASGGTLFLDEVGEMPAVMQAKLLRVLQEGEVVPVGDHRPRRIDVRVISATNRDLQTEVELKTFREDLYYRIATFPILLPPLRERAEDILPIASRILGAIASRHGKEVRGFAREAAELLASHRWPGNVRELHNEIERATALVVSGGAITPEHLSPKVRSATRVTAQAPAGDETRPPMVPPQSTPAADPPEQTDRPPIVLGDALPDSLREARDLFEAVFIERAVQRCGGNVTRAAQQLGISRSSIHSKLRELKVH